MWNIRSSLVNALATFIVLSYIKILNVSFELLMPSYVFNMEGKRINKAYLYYDGGIEMASRVYIQNTIPITCHLYANSI